MLFPLAEGSGAVITAANLVYFHAHIFAGLRCGRLAFALGLACFLNCLPLSPAGIAFASRVRRRY
jgi:hypothetical protein